MSYCTSCYREVPAEETRCSRCSRQDSVRPFSRTALVIGAIGIVILIAGVLTLDARTCFAGAAIAAVGVIVRLAAL